MLRNRRTIIFTLIFPAALFFAIGSGTGWQEKVGHGNVAAYVMVSMALYGAALTAASAGAMVATERALGWSRQLRLTPLNPAVYIGMKALIALILGAVAILGRQRGRRSSRAGRRCRPHLWVAVRRPDAWSARWCSRRSASSSGTSSRARTPCRSSGPGLALLSFLGNVFIPIDLGQHDVDVAAWTPMFGVAEVSRRRSTGELPVVRRRERRRLARRCSSPAPRGGSARTRPVSEGRREASVDPRELADPDAVPGPAATAGPGASACCSPRSGWCSWPTRSARRGPGLAGTDPLRGWVGLLATVAFAAFYVAAVHLGAAPTAADAARASSRPRP